MEESQKAHKSSGVSTPRGEHSRSSTSQGYGSDAGSVSFLRDRRDGGDGGEDGPQQRQREQASPSSNAVPTGFVKVDNIPDSVSDASIRQLAHGISGVGRVLVSFQGLFFFFGGIGRTYWPVEHLYLTVPSLFHVFVDRLSPKRAIGRSFSDLHQSTKPSSSVDR